MRQPVKWCEEEKDFIKDDNPTPLPPVLDRDGEVFDFLIGEPCAICGSKQCHGDCLFNDERTARKMNNLWY